MFFSTLGIIASSIERLAVEIRHLQKTELQEVEEFFEKWPDAESASRANEEEMKFTLKTLGMTNKRSRTIIRMSKQFADGFNQINQLHGCGKYASDLAPCNGGPDYRFKGIFRIT